LKAINIDFMPASEAAEFVPATSQLAYSEHLMALRFIVGVVSIPGSELYAQPLRLTACPADFERNSGLNRNARATAAARSSAGPLFYFVWSVKKRKFRELQSQCCSGW